MNCLETSDLKSELLLVDDGSRDSSRHKRSLEATAKDPRITLVTLSRNFGHQGALQAGLEHATGDAVILLDGDLQDPPELFPELIQSWREGNQGCNRRKGVRVRRRALRDFCLRLLL